MKKPPAHFKTTHARQTKSNRRNTPPRSGLVQPSAGLNSHPLSGFVFSVRNERVGLHLYASRPGVCESASLFGKTRRTNEIAHVTSPLVIWNCLRGL